MKRLFPYAIVLIFPFILYLNTVSHNYAYDDFWVLVNNRLVEKGLGGIPDILTTSLWAGAGDKSLGYYRPLFLITFAVEKYFFGGNPHISHIINIILYSFTGLALLIFLKKIFREESLFIPAVTTLLFLSHPIHTEAVANIKSRDEILCFLNLILAVHYFLRYNENRSGSSLMSSSLFYLLALFSKIQAVAFLAIAPLAVYFFSQDFGFRKVFLLTPHFSISVFYFLIKNFFIGSIFGPAPTDLLNYPLMKTPIFSRLPTIIAMWGKYISLLIFPHPLVYDYSYNQFPARGWNDISVIFFFILFIVPALHIAINLRKKKSVHFAILFFFITIAIPLSIAFIKGGIMTERSLYIPSLGFCLFIAILADKLARYKALSYNNTCAGNIRMNHFLIIPLGLLLLSYSARTITRNYVWKDNITLFSSDVKYCKDNARAHYNLGSALVNDIAQKEDDAAEKEDILNQAIGELQKALEIYPEYDYAYNNLGRAFAEKGDWNSAILCYKDAIRINARHSYAYNNLGNAYLAKGDFDRAIEHFNKAISLDLNHPFLYNNMGLAFLNKGDYSNSIKYFEMSIQSEPTFIKPYYNLILIYEKTGNREKADYYRQMISFIKR